MRAYLSDRAARHASLYVGYPSSDHYRQRAHLTIPDCELRYPLTDEELRSAAGLATLEATRILASAETAGKTQGCANRHYALDSLGYAGRNLAESLARFIALDLDSFLPASVTIGDNSAE